jgi:hypothetical protein
MRFPGLILAIIIVAAGAASAQYQIDWWVIGSGGGTSTSPSYQLSGTIGQPIVGVSSSSNYTVEAGFWVGFPAGPELCAYLKGDINNVPPANGIDITYGVSYLKGGNPPPVRCDMCPQPAPFYAAMDVNGTCNTNGIDITYFVSFLKGGSALMFCPTCPPEGMMGAPPVVPALSPVSVPNLTPRIPGDLGNQ